MSSTRPLLTSRAQRAANNIVRHPPGCFCGSANCTTLPARTVYPQARARQRGGVSRLAYFMRQFLQLFRKWQRHRLAVLRILLIQSFGWDVDYAQVRKVYETGPGTGCSASLLARAC